MPPTSCARCGAPLPAVAVDPMHPDWCAACAARALQPPGVVPPPPRPGAVPFGTPAQAAVPLPGTEVVRTRPLDGLLVGLAAAGIGGLLWWAVSWITEIEQWQGLSFIVGLAVGVGVLVGARRGGLVAGLLALVISVVAVAVTAYFIDRSLAIASLEASGIASDIPLWQGFGHARDALQFWIDEEPANAAGWLLGPFIAVLVAGWPGRRPPFG